MAMQRITNTANFKCHLVIWHPIPSVSPMLLSSNLSNAKVLPHILASCSPWSYSPAVSQAVSSALDKGFLHLLQKFHSQDQSSSWGNSLDRAFVLRSAGFSFVEILKASNHWRLIACYVHILPSLTQVSWKTLGHLLNQDVVATRVWLPMPHLGTLVLSRCKAPACGAWCQTSYLHTYTTSAWLSDAVRHSYNTSSYPWKHHIACQLLDRTHCCLCRPCHVHFLWTAPIGFRLVTTLWGLPGGPAGNRTATGSLSATSRTSPYQLLHRDA